MSVANLFDNGNVAIVRYRVSHHKVLFAASLREQVRK